MATATQAQRDDLSDRVISMAPRYSDVPPEQRELVFVTSIIEGWIMYRTKLEELHSNRGLGRVLRGFEGFLSGVKSYFHRVIDELMLDYETTPPYAKKPDFIRRTYDAAREALHLYFVAGLQRVAKKDERKHIQYLGFVKQLKADLKSTKGSGSSSQMHTSQISDGSQSSRQKGVITAIYETSIRFQDSIGTRDEFNFAIGVDSDGNAYWASPLGHLLLPNQTYFPFHKKLNDLTQHDLTLELAVAYRKASRLSGLQVDVGPEDIATKIGDRFKGKITQVYSELREKIKQVNSEPNGPLAKKF